MKRNIQIKYKPCDKEEAVMAYDEKEMNKMQNIILENRNNLMISGVLDVLNFDEQMITLETELRYFSGKRRRFKTEQI